MIEDEGFKPSTKPSTAPTDCNRLADGTCRSKNRGSLRYAARRQRARILSSPLNSCVTPQSMRPDFAAYFASAPPDLGSSVSLRLAPRQPPPPPRR